MCLILQCAFGKYALYEVVVIGNPIEGGACLPCRYIASPLLTSLRVASSVDVDGVHIAWKGQFVSSSLILIIIAVLYGLLFHYSL